MNETQTTPPPGANVNAINTQTNQLLSVPGQQGAGAQGYGDQYKSSFAWPSSYSVPSSINAPNQFYEQSNQPNSVQDMIRALRGA